MLLNSLNDDSILAWRSSLLLKNFTTISVVSLHIFKSINLDKVKSRNTTRKFIAGEFTVLFPFLLSSSLVILWIHYLSYFLLRTSECAWSKTRLIRVPKVHLTSSSILGHSDSWRLKNEILPSLRWPSARCFRKENLSPLELRVFDW